MNQSAVSKHYDAAANYHQVVVEAVKGATS
jgi:hypothetical protein